MEMSNTNNKTKSKLVRFFIFVAFCITLYGVSYILELHGDIVILPSDEKEHRVHITNFRQLLLNTDNNYKSSIMRDREHKLFNGYRIVNGVYVPTKKVKEERFKSHPESVKNWHGQGISNCPSNNKDLNNNNIYPVNLSNWRFDGAGAQLSDILEYIAFYRKNQTKYHWYYFPMDWNHYILKKYLSNNITIDQYDEDINYALFSHFVNVGDGERNIYDKNNECICCHWNIKFKYNPYYLFDKDTLKYLQIKYWKNKNQYIHIHSDLYDIDYFNVAVHVRRGDIMNEKRKSLTNNFYIELIKYIFKQQIKLNKTRVVSFNIYSQHKGFNKSEFESDLKKENNAFLLQHQLFEISYFIDYPLILTFHAFVISDSFIMSPSALSWAAAIFSNSSYIYFKRWTHPPLRHWIYVDIKDGKRENCQCNSSIIHLDDHSITLCNSWHCNYPKTIQL